MRKLATCLIGLMLAFAATQIHAEGTKQLMPNSSDRLWLEFNVFGTNGFGTYGCPVDKRLNIRMKSGEKAFFGMKMNASNYGGNVSTSRYRVHFRVCRPDGTVIFAERTMPGSGTGYITDYAHAITGPNGAILNSVTISGGYTPYTFTADQTGDFYIEFEHDYDSRFALEFFDFTVTDASNNIVTNAGAPNVPAGRLWSKSWQLTTTSFTQYKVNNYFYVFTSDDFVNKINFQYYPFSFIFQSNSYGLIKPVSESNYIKRAQSKDDNQTTNALEYRVYLDDPDQIVWPTTLLAPPTTQVWADDSLFYDYNYTRNPQQLSFADKDIYLEKNRVGCTYSSIAIFKITSNIDAFTAILLDLDGDGSYSTNGSDRVIYRDMAKGNNYILWDFKTDAGAEVAPGNYYASATFMGRGPTNFPVYDVEQCDGVTTSSVRPFKKLNATIYWDDTNISRWGDETGNGLMDETQQKQLVIGNNIPRIWSWNSSLENVNFNGNMNTMNTWFNAIDLGYSSITIHVSQSTTKCVNGLAPWVGDIYKEGLPNNTITFSQANFTKKFFDPTEDALTLIRVLSLPTNGTLKLSGTAITVNQEIALANLGNITFTPNTDWFGRTSFDWEAKNSQFWSMNTDKVYLTVNTPPTISTISDQDLCTNNPSPAIPFTVNDAETPAADLTVTAFSHDPTFVPNGNIILGGSGSSRTITVTPVANKSGFAIVYVMVDDGYSQVITKFAVYVGPDLEFSGDTTVCVGQDLNLVAEEVGAVYAWKYGSTTMSTSQVLSITWGSFSPGTWSLTVQKNGCNSTRYFEVEISPNTSFSGDPNVCVGEEIYLSAEENNASYVWRNGTTIVSTTKQFTKSSAALSDAGTNYTLEVTKDGCNATSNPFEISVINQPNIGLTVTGNTVDPGHDGTITVNSSQTGVTYNVYKNESYITTATGTGSNLNITVPAVNLSVGSNVFTVKADNGNCEIPLSSTATITVRTPGFTISAISRNTTEAGGTATFTVVLKTQPTSNVTLPLSSSDATEGTVSPTSLTFTTSNWNTPQTVTVTGVDDYVVDGNVAYSIITGTSSSSDTYYSGIDPDDISLQNIDNDIAAVIVNPTSGLSTTESGGTATFSIRLASQPSANVTLTLYSNNTSEGTIVPTSVTFASGNWNINQTITVTGVDENIDDGDIVYTIVTSNTSSSDPLFNNLTVDDVLVTNVDNDVTGILVTPTSGLTTTEAGGQATFSIRLNSQPTQNVTVELSSSNTAEGTVSPSSVTFTSANWNTPQNVTVTGVNDDVDDGNKTYSIVTAPAVSSDATYNNYNASDVTVVNTDDDTAGIVVVPTSGLTTTEAGGTATFTVKLNSRPTSSVTISLTSSDATEGSVSPTSLSFTTTNWSSSQTVTITGIDDFTDDGDIAYSINGSSSSSDVNYNGKSFTVSASNTDNDVAGITVNPTSGLTTTESGGTATFTVVLTSQPSANVVIGLSSSNTAEGTVSPTSITFTSANWNVSQTVTVTGVDDASADGPQAYTIITAAATSSDALYNGKNPADVSVTNNDNDVAGVTVTPTSLTTVEGGSVVTFTIVLNTKPTQNVTINLSSSDISEGTVSPSSVQFTTTNWNTSQTVTVTPVDDYEADGSVTYSIVTSNAVSTDPNYSNFNVNDVSVTNADNDNAGFTVNPISGLTTTEAGGTATFTVKLTSKPTANVTISITSNNTLEGTAAPSSLTFTASNWNTNQTVTITGVNDDVADGNVSYSIITGSATSTDVNYNGKNPADVSVTNIDNDNAGFTVIPTSGLTTTELGGTAAFTIRLNSKPLSNVTIALSSSNSSEGLVSPTSVTFTPTNWNTNQTVTITGVDDDIDDDDVTYQIITNPATSSDATYSGLNPADVLVTNTDNDVAGITVNPVSGLTTTEAGGTASFTIVLNTRPTANVTIALSSSNTNEGTISTSSLTFTPANWNLAQTVIITGVDDDIDDDNVAYSIITNPATSSDTKYNGYNPQNVSVTNTDNDDAGFTVSPISGLSTTEAGGTATFTVKLNTRPTANVTIGLSSSNTAEGTVSPSSLIFTSTNWNALQTVTVTGVDDYVDDGDVVFTVITAAAVSVDTKYNGTDPENVTVTNADNDEAGVTVTPYSGLYTTEAGGTATFTVRLNSKPLSNVQITLVSSNSAEGIVSPNSLTFTTSNWSANQTVTITGVNDDVDDDDQAYTIETQPCVSSDPKYDNYNPVDVSVTNRDDDQAGYNVSNTSISYSEGDVPVEVTFSLKSKPTADVQFTVSSDNTSKGTVVPAGLTFTQSNWSVPQTVTITPVNNSIVDGDVLFNVVTDLPTTTDAKYAGLNPPDIAVTCIDDDVAGVTVSAISGNTREDGTTAEFTVVLTSEPTDDVTIPITSLNTSEGTVSPAILTFTGADWSTPQTVTVTGEDDAAVDGNQTFTVEVGMATSTDTIYDGYNPDDVTVINIDDDQAGVNVFPTSGLVTSEAGDTDTFQMSLNTIPTDDVSVTFTSTNTSEGTVSPTTHVFTGANWNSPVIVTLTGVDDLIADGDQAYTVSITTSSSDANYNLMPIDPVSATNLDDTIPRAVNDVATTDEDTQKNIEVLFNDLGLDAGGLTVIIASNPLNGTVNVESDNTVTYTPDGIFNGDDVFKYRVTDANGAYDEASVTVTVTFVDDQPVAVDDSRGTSMNTLRVIDVLFNDSGLEDGGIVVSIDTQADPVKGEAVANADNTVTFTPAPDYMGIATFKYKVTDNDGDFATATVTVNVREINHIPDAVDDNASTYVDTDVTVNVLSNDSGLDDGFKDITVHADPANGSVVVNADRTVTYTPNAGFSGTDSFIYLLEDIDGDYDVATVTITVTAKPDFHPVANDDRRGTSLDTPVTVDVLLNDTGLDDGLASMSITTLPVNGSATVNADNTITYTPNTGYYGTEIFGYQICDTDGDCDAANVIVTVKNGVNYVPVANDDKDSTYLNTPVTINVIENDSGLEDGFDSLEIFEEPQFGTVVVNADRTVTYTPTYMFIGEETFKYIITDVDGDYGIATVTVKVYEKPNFIPVANDDRRGCSFNTAVNVDVLFNDTNLDDVPVTVTVSEAPAQGNVSVNSDNTVTFTPAPDFVGIMTFRYTVTDADGDSDDAMVSINVKSGENVVPSAVADEATTIVNTPVTVNVLANDEGLDDGFNDLQVYSQPQFGTVIVNADRTVTYTPSYMFIGTETFRYYIEDVDGDYSLATVTVSVIERPDYHPTANDDARGCSFNSSVIIDVLENDENINDTPLTLAFTIPPSIGFAVINADNTVTFTSDNDYVGVVTFGYSVTDADGDSDDAQVVVTVKPGENNVPVAQDDNAQTLVNTPVDVNILANDRGLEDGFGEIYIKQQPSFGSVVINANRTVTYFPGYMFIGSDSFTYKLTDVDGDYSVATVTITVIDKPDYQPVANDDARGCSFNSAVTVDVLANDTGLDDTPVTVSISVLPSSGSAVVNPDNTVTFTPVTNFTGIMTFGYTVTDADGDSDNALVTINVKEGENIAPVAVDDAASTLINQSVAINVLANDSGLEDGFDELTIFEQPQFGSVVVNANRTVTYTPSYMFVGTETFRYKIIDVDGDYAMATVTVTVTDRPNYIPVANDDRRGCSFNQSVKIDVLFNDKNLDDIPIAVSVAENPLSGSVVVNADNTITFTPSTDFIGFMTFRYVVTDVDGDSDDAQVTVNVKEGENYWPMANDDAASTIVNKSVDINVLANDSGLDDGLERLLIQSSPQFGSVIINENNTITYTPSYMFLGTDSFEYLVEDFDGDYSVATVTVTVTERGNVQPVANDDYRGTAINTARIVDVLVNDTGLDDEPIVVTVKSLPQNGSAVVNSDNTITYTPGSNYLGMDSLEYTVTDVDGDFDNAYAFINVKPVNMIPVASDDYVETYVNTAVDIHILDNDTLLYEGIKSVQIHAAPIWGTATVNADYTVTYTPSYFYVGNDEFKYIVEDVDGDYAMATVYVSVIPKPNSIPVANDDSRGTSINMAVVVDVLLNDDGLDDTPVGIYIKDKPDVATGSATVNLDNTVTFTPATDYLGKAAFTYFIVDNNNDTSNVANVNINVKEVNFIPIANPDTAETVMNLPVLIDVINNDTNLDDGLSYFKIFNKPLHGFAYVFDNSNIRYIPSSWFVGTDSLEYIVYDTDGDYGIAKVYITVKERPDHKPVAMPDGRGTIIDNPVSVDVLFNDKGLEDGGIVVLVNSSPLNGSVIVNADNTVTYTPKTGYYGEDVFYYQVCDFDSDCSSAAVTINVKTTNAVPIANNDVITTYKNRAVSIDVLFNDQNKTDGGISVSVLENPANGSASVNADYTIEYTPTTDFFGSDSLKYYLKDIDGDYDVATVYITVLNRENYTPSAQDDDYETYINVTILCDVLTNDTGLDDGVKSLEVETAPTNGLCTITNDLKIQYSPLNGFKGSDTFTYKVTDTDDEASVAYVTVTVNADPNKKIDIPEAFSPNGDDINDTFEILNIEQYQRIKLKVYNRWGNLVYKNDNYTNNWDGSANVSMAIGTRLPAGTYYYLIEIVDNGKMYKGSVFIKR